MAKIELNSAIRRIRGGDRFRVMDGTAVTAAWSRGVKLRA